MVGERSERCIIVCAGAAVLRCPVFRNYKILIGIDIFKSLSCFTLDSKFYLIYRVRATATTVHQTLRFRGAIIYHRHQNMNNLSINYKNVNDLIINGLLKILQWESPDSSCAKWKIKSLISHASLFKPKTIR